MSSELPSNSSSNVHDHCCPPTLTVGCPPQGPPAVGRPCGGVASSSRSWAWSSTRRRCSSGPAPRSWTRHPTRPAAAAAAGSVVVVAGSLVVVKAPPAPCTATSPPLRLSDRSAPPWVSITVIRIKLARPRTKTNTPACPAPGSHPPAGPRAGPVGLGASRSLRTPCESAHSPP